MCLKGGALQLPSKCGRVFFTLFLLVMCHNKKRGESRRLRISVSLSHFLESRLTSRLTFSRPSCGILIANYDGIQGRMEETADILSRFSLPEITNSYFMADSTPFFFRGKGMVEGRWLSIFLLLGPSKKDRTNLSLFPEQDWRGKQVQ